MKKREWIEVARALELDNHARIRCPECSYEFLKVQDILLEKWGKVDRYIYCENCSSKMAITFDIKKN